MSPLGKKKCVFLGPKTNGRLMRNKNKQLPHTKIPARRRTHTHPHSRSILWTASLLNRAQNMSYTREALCVQAVHLPFHFCCVVITSEQVRKALSMSDEEKGCVMYLNSLKRSDAPKIRSVESINSPILRDMVEGLSDFCG